MLENAQLIGKLNSFSESAAFSHRIREVLWCHELYEKTPNRCEQDSSKKLPGWFILKLPLLLLSFFCCWSVAVVIVDVDMVNVVFKKKSEMKWSRSRSCKNGFFFSPPGIHLKKNAMLEKGFVSERIYMVLFHKHFFFKQSFWPLSQPPIDYECLPLSGWWQWTLDLLDVSRVYPCEDSTCPVEQLLIMP